MSVAVYVRVSTASQNEAGQKQEIMKWLAGNGINTKNVLWYVDKESGETLKRPEFEQLQKDIFNGAHQNRCCLQARSALSVAQGWC